MGLGKTLCIMCLGRRTLYNEIMVKVFEVNSSVNLAAIKAVPGER